MKRASFLKTLLGIAAAPAILKDVKAAPKAEEWTWKFSPPYPPSNDFHKRDIIALKEDVLHRHNFPEYFVNSVNHDTKTIDAVMIDWYPKEVILNYEEKEYVRICSTYDEV